MLSRRSLTCVAAALALLGTERASAQGVLKIGAINPYSGPLALYGDELTRGFELAVDRVNAAGGVLGRRIQVVRGSARRLANSAWLRPPLERPTASSTSSALSRAAVPSADFSDMVCAPGRHPGCWNSCRRPRISALAVQRRAS